MNKTTFENSVFAIYLLLLGICIGVEISVGILVAPVIFFPTNFLGEGVLTHFQSGILMTQIFLKFNMLFMFITIFILFYEIYTILKKRWDLTSLILAFIIICCAFLFVFYFTPFIVEAQALGPSATSSEKFLDMHKGSELVIKVALLAQVLLFFRKIFIKVK